MPAGPIHDIAGAFGLAERLGLDPVATVEGEPTVANPITARADPGHLPDGATARWGARSLADVGQADAPGTS